MEGKKDIKLYDMEELIVEMSVLGEKTFRAKQVYEWLHVKLVKDFDEMTNLSKALREKLNEKYYITTARLVKMFESKIDGTRKFLFQFRDKQIVESVWMKYKHGNSVCVSSQIGCRMGCQFCASTLDGLERSLTSSEILEQVYEISRITGERVSNVVVMGMGEPFDNYENLIKFILMITDKNGLNISQRNITVSTCGIVPKMREFADEGMQVTLAISLHCTTDEKRKSLMPITNKYNIEEVLDACRYFYKKTSRRITFEYGLVKGVNDQEEDASELIELVRDLNCHVNLIPINPIKERDFEQSEEKYIYSFKNKLEKNNINVTIRREMGRDIEGACGQLRRSNIEEVDGEVGC